MAIKETSGHILEIGDRVKINNPLLLQPAPQDRFEVIKNMTLEEMSKDLLPMILGLCEEGVPSAELVQEWLCGKPEEEA